MKNKDSIVGKNHSEGFTWIGELGANNSDTIYNKASDSDLWLMLKSGDEQAMGFIYSKYVNDIYRFGNQLVEDKELLKDSIQDVFINLIKSNKSAEEVVSIKSYLFKSLYREVMDKLRAERKLDLQSSFDGLEKKFEIAISVESIMISDERSTDQIKNVREELNKLSQKQKQAILHYYYDGFTHQEIAEIMGVTNKSTAAKLIRRGLDVIRKNLLSLLPPIISSFS